MKDETRTYYRQKFANEEERAVKIEMYDEGPWIDEPDQVEFDSHGFNLEIIRNRIGALCGYIKILPGHPWYKNRLDYDRKDREENAIDTVSVHYGFTFAEQDGDYWVLGFDCAHSEDICPSLEKLIKTHKEKHLNRFLEEMKKNFPNCILFNKTYKDINWVENELIDLAAQAELAAKK